MDNQRLILITALLFVSFLLWQAWQRDYGPQAPVSAETPVSTETAPDVAVTGDVPSAPQAESPVVPVEAAVKPQRARIKVVTDLLQVEIDSLGGAITEADLLVYPVSTDKPDEPFRVLNESADKFFIAQSGLLSRDGPAPDHHQLYQAQATEYYLAPGQEKLEVPLTWTSPEGVSVTKIFTFHRDSYVVDVTHVINNNTGTDWQGQQYRQFQRVRVGRESRFIYTYTGGVIYSPEKKYEKLSFDEMAKNNLSRDFSGGWAAMIQHYFLAAWLPNPEVPEHYYSKALPGERFVLGMVSQPVKVASGEIKEVSSRFFVGPKLHSRLKNVAKGLELTVDYGYLTFIAEPLFLGLKWIHKVLGNWGWSIIVLTVLIKLLFYKLSETSYRSMANMRRMAPRMQALKERYGDDRQRMSQAMMELYKKEKINPLGGCLPIVIQIPVFIALYWVLLESVEMRQAPFILWIKDLSTKDPYYVLPVLMGLSMFIQQRLNPQMMDPIQQRVMMLLPFVFTVFFAFFPAGLVLYWTVNNSLSITQQWVITRRIEKAAA